MLRIAFAGATMMLLAGCGGPSSQEANDLSAEEAEEIFLERFNALQDRMGGAGLSAYDPLKPVPGATAWTPLPERSDGEQLISTDTLNAAKNYAAANNSSAFIVWLDGAIESAEYFGDTTAETLIVSKSLAKPLGVIAVGRAIQEGHIDTVDQPAADFFHEWQGTPKEKILIRHLLDMRTGLLPQGPAPDPSNILNRAYLHPFHDQVIIDEYPLINKPGNRYEYANANSELVAPLIERATGSPYEDWLTDAVFSPIGAKGGEVWMNREGGTPHSGCCILLPAETYLRLAILLLDDGAWGGDRLLPEGYVQDMRTTTAQNQSTGMGVYVGSPYTERRGAAHPDLPYGRTLHSEPYLAEDLFLFDGNSNQVVYIVPSKRLVVLRTGGRPPQEPEWDNAFLPNQLLRALN